MGFCWNGLGWGGWGTSGGLGIVGLILNLVFFVGVLAVLGLGATWLARQFSRQPVALQTEGSACAPQNGSALEIARRRLAAGELTIAEFEEMRDRLQR